MGFSLRSLFQDKPMSNKAVSSSTTSNSVNIGAYEGPFAIQVIWTGGVSVNMDLSLELSTNNRDWAPFAGSSVNITSSADNHMWDIQGTGAEFIRVKITVNSGSANFTVHFNGKGRS